MKKKERLFEIFNTVNGTKINEASYFDLPEETIEKTDEFGRELEKEIKEKRFYEIPRTIQLGDRKLELDPESVEHEPIESEFSGVDPQFTYAAKYITEYEGHKLPVEMSFTFDVAQKLTSNGVELEMSLLSQEVYTIDWPTWAKNL